MIDRKYFRGNGMTFSNVIHYAGRTSEHVRFEICLLNITIHFGNEFCFSEFWSKVRGIDALPFQIRAYYKLWELITNRGMPEETKRAVIASLP
ncbi:hypothetical protein WA026_015645 [Henosepilachna vigintioctopunctata]|uniref:LAGLIDADG homing endonuclease n=1 Tax=Henosepilachna vigintioctopunctata TaxID=420089 RepID=A0AAW1VHE5_9CUCU